MGLQVKNINDVVSKMTLSNCGAITCIYNVDGKCSQNECEIHERGFKREED